MRQSFVKINNIPTHVMTWGRWVEENGKPNEDIVLVIPGNPGLSGYYQPFLNTIHDKLGYPCWTLSHAGHEEPKLNVLEIPSLKGNNRLFDLQAQVNHKIEFFNKYVPEGSKVHLIGHSIGAYVILELLKIPEINEKIVDCYLLFPVIENIRETPNGKFFINIMKYLTWIPILLSYIFILLPEFIQYFLIYLYCLWTGVNKCFIPTTIHLIRPTILRKVFYMAFNEMKNVGELDLDLINANKHKLRFYYAVDDGWAPAAYCKKLLRDCPDVNAEICGRNFDHAYILRHSEASANMVADWIKSRA